MWISAKLGSRTSDLCRNELIHDDTEESLDSFICLNILFLSKAEANISTNLSAVSTFINVNKFVYDDFFMHQIKCINYYTLNVSTSRTAALINAIFNYADGPQTLE